MQTARLGWIDESLILVYTLIMVGMGIFFIRKSRTPEQFMVAGHSIPAWAAGLAVMSTYTSSISYIAIPGKAFDTNWHPFIFALCIFPVAGFVSRYIVPYYWKRNLISVYEFLGERLGVWARVYASLAFLLYMTGRVAVILYLVGLLLGTFISQPITNLIIFIGVVTILYTLLGGMEAVIWTDVVQSAIMIAGIIYVAMFLAVRVWASDLQLLYDAVSAGKFSLGSLKFSLTSRTIWVMIIYGITENLRNLMADQNYVQKYVSVRSFQEVRQSIWTAMLIYIPLTAIFLFIGTSLFVFYGVKGLPVEITKGDQVFPYFIATQVPQGLKGLIIAAIIAAAMSTVDSALNCSATVTFLDFLKHFIAPPLTEKRSVLFLRILTLFWGILGTGFAILMINVKSALDVWWTISGIFGGGILGLFMIALIRPRIRKWHGVIGVIISILTITWATFARDLPPEWGWLESHLEEIIIGAVGTFMMVVVILGISFLNPVIDKKRIEIK